jgi:hypothetical protein
MGSKHRAQLCGQLLSLLHDEVAIAGSNPDVSIIFPYKVMTYPLNSWLQQRPSI